MTKTVTLIGVTGMIGGYLYELLKQDTSIDRIRLLVRRPFPTDDPRTEVKLVDFSDMESFRLGLEGSHTVFCAVGTTNRHVKGDKEAYRKVDYDIPVNAARFCKLSGGEMFVLVSAVGADSHSRTFYLRLKGEVEDAIRTMGIKTVHVMRPSLLTGERKDVRTGEKIAALVMPVISFLLPSRYRAIHGRDVAKAMIAVSEKNQPGFYIHEYAGMLSQHRNNNSYESKWSRIASAFDRHFDFLSAEFGMHPVPIPASFYKMDMYVRMLKNEFVQVELAGRKDYFAAIIRRLYQGQPAPYFDKDNNIGFEKLSVLLTRNTEAHLAYHTSAVGWEKALGYAASLMKQSKPVLTSDQWIDIKKLEELEDAEFFKKWGSKPSEIKHAPHFFRMVTTRATEIASTKGFVKVRDTAELPPYDYLSMTQTLQFERPGTRLELAQMDWRDNYNSYYIQLNEVIKFTMDITDHTNTEEAVSVFIEELKKVLE